MLLIYVMALWFFILLFSDKNYFWSSVVILISISINVALDDVFNITSSMYLSEAAGTLIKLDGLTALTLTLLFYRDRLALKMCLLLTFAVLCHTMLIYDIKINSSFVSSMFNARYEELIFLIGILQMWISYDGITSALGNVRRCLQRFYFCGWRNSQNSFFHQRDKKAQ